jgi:hypothetical protein
MSESPLTITFADHVYDNIKATIGSQPPETGGILGADLNISPLHIVRFVPVPAARSGYHSGAGAAYFSPDHRAINHIVDNVWTPLGYWLAGVIHSHPRDFRRLSGGSRADNDGDLAFFNNLLNHAESRQKGLDTFIAPIVTFPRGPEQMALTVWTLRRGDPNPRQARVAICHQGETIPLAAYERRFQRLSSSLTAETESSDVKPLNETV